MAFGVTSTGFNAKRLADIKTEIENAIKATFGSGVNLDARGPFGQLIGIFAERESLVWELAEQVYNSQWPQNASGAGLDNALSLVGLTRKQATFSVVTLKLFGDDGTVIPAGSEISKSDDDTVIFETTTQGTILAGTGTDEIQSIAFSAVPDAGAWQLNFDGQLTSSLAFNLTAAQLETELENLSNIGAGNVSVSGNFTNGFEITFENDLGEQNVALIVIEANTLENSSNPVTATPTEDTAGVLPNVEVEAQASVSGEVAAPAGSLTVIETPVSGWDSVTNELDATLGQEIESDADAKQRRNESLAFPGHSTIPAIIADLLQIEGVIAARGFENTSLIVDSAGRPAKSFEMVVQGGDQTTIAEAIRDAKPAGIQTYGALSNSLTDSQGFPITVFFSRPTLVPIYIVLDLTVNAEYPADGDDLVKAALVAFGDALSIGEAIVVLPKLICALDAIPGIEDIGIVDAVIRIGTASLPTPDNDTVTFTNVTSDLAAELTSHPLENTNRVYFTTTGTLPSGLTPNQTYWVREKTTNNFKLSATRTGDLIDFVDAGSGTHTVYYGGLDENIAISDSELADFDTSRITVNS